jgi:hypothetical protein
MKSFKGHLLEEVAWTESLSTMLFDLPRGGIVDLKIPLSPSIFKRLWPKPIRSRVFHVTDYDGVGNLVKLQGRKRSISAFYNIAGWTIDDGIRTDGGYVVELDADVLAAAPDDISSAPDTGGTRWLSWSTIFRTMGDQKYLKNMENDLNEFLIELIMQYADDPIHMPNVNKSWIALGKEYRKEKRVLYEIIKDYIDGIEQIIRKHGKELHFIFTNYVGDRHLAPDPDSGDYEEWDELVVNNIKIIKIHVGPEFAPDFEEDDDIDGFPFKGWDNTSDLTKYIAHKVKKDLKKKR